MRLNDLFRPASLKKTALTGILLAGLACNPGCAPKKQELQLSPTEMALQMDTFKKDYTNYLTKSEELMQKSIRAKYLSKDAQNELYAELSRLENSISCYEILRNKCPEETERLNLPVEQNAWLTRLYKNLEDHDGNPPEIQKYLEKKYPGFKADAVYSQKERDDDFEAARHLVNTIIDAVNSN